MVYGMEYACEMTAREANATRDVIAALKEAGIDVKTSYTDSKSGVQTLRASALEIQAQGSNGTARCHVKASGEFEDMMMADRASKAFQAYFGNGFRYVPLNQN